MNGWKWATEAEADAARTLMLKAKMNPMHGKFVHDNLLLHFEGENHLNGILYFIPDYYGTILQELYVEEPGLLFTLPKIIAKTIEERGWHRLILGLVDLTQNRWSMVLQEMGAVVESVKMLHTWTVPQEAR